MERLLRLSRRQQHQHMDMAYQSEHMYKCFEEKGEVIGDCQLLKDKPMILETPNELPGYAREIALLRSMEA